MGRLVHRMETLAAAPARPIPTTSTSSSTATGRHGRRPSCCGSTRTIACCPRWLGRVDIPCLIVWGDDDRLLPVELAPAWAALLPQATVATFPAAGHLVLDEAPAAAQAVATFCAPT